MLVATDYRDYNTKIHEAPGQKNPTENENSYILNSTLHNPRADHISSYS